MLKPIGLSLLTHWTIRRLLSLYFSSNPEVVVEKLHRALKQLQPSREIIACDFGNEHF